MFKNRMLHWGVKVGNLSKTIDFMTNILGMKVLTHEEMSEGCKLNCNGPWDKPWSKTMIGYGSELDHFIFEVAFNYGVNEYKLGNDFRCATITEGNIPERAKSAGFEVKNDDDGKHVIDYDGYKWVLIPGDKPKVHSITLNANELNPLKRFYGDLLGLNIFEESENLLRIGLQEGDGEVHFKKISEPINHGETFGRLAIAYSDIPKMEEKLKKENTEIRFKTQMLGPVQVCVVADPAGYEVCLAKDNDYAKQAKSETGATVDWMKRAQKLTEYQTKGKVQGE